MRKKPEPLTGVLQKSGFSAKLNIRNSNQNLCKTEHLCFNFRHIAKPQNVSAYFKKTTP